MLCSFTVVLHFGEIIVLYYSRQDNIASQFVQLKKDPLKLITDSMATEAEVVEMFGRYSMLGGYDFSNLKLESKHQTTIPALLDGTEINCVCEEYIPHNQENVDTADVVLKIYYVKKEPYAIQAREDNRFMYYITSWK